MSDYAARIAAASGDAGALLSLAIELAQEVSRLSAEAATLEARRQKDAERKRNRRPRISADIRGSHRNGAEIRDPSSPAPSLLPPTPPNNTSSPPSPAALHRAPEEARLLERAPEASAVIARMLDGFAGVQRMSWVGRLHGVLDRPPTPTGAELNDALEDMLTKPRENWGPMALRAFVRRIRGEGEERPAAANPAPSGKSDPVSDAAWMAVLALLPKWQRREVTTATFDEMTPAMRAGISAVGGFQRIAATTDDKRVWLKQEFVAGFRAAPAKEKVSA